MIEVALPPEAVAARAETLASSEALRPGVQRIHSKQTGEKAWLLEVRHEEAEGRGCLTVQFTVTETPGGGGSRIERVRCGKADDPAWQVSVEQAIWRALLGLLPRPGADSPC